MRLVLLCALPCLAACGTSTVGHPSPDGGDDAAATDMSVRDAGPVDLGAVDAGAIDAGDVDAGTPDSGPPDAGPPDLGPPCPGGPVELDLHLATLYANPPDLADWPVTTTLTAVNFTTTGVHVEFSKLDGPGRWPDVVPPMWTGPLEYTLGMAECIGGHWYASAVIEYWYGLSESGGNVAMDSQVAVNWFYDAGRWGMLAGRQPATGETIGIFVAAGNLRNVTTDDPLQSPVMERSNVVLVPMPDVTGATHSF